MIFLFIDKTDEYQLVKYILVFKKMQFFTAGCIAGVIGYIFFFSCSTLNEYVTEEDMKKYHRNTTKNLQFFTLTELLNFS